MSQDPSPYSPPESEVEPESAQDYDLAPRGPGSPPGPTDLIRELWEIATERPTGAVGYPLLVMFGAGMINFVGVFVLQLGIMLPARASEEPPVALFIVFAVLMVGFALLMTTLMTGALHIIWLRVVRGQSIDLADVLYVRRFIIPLLGTNLLVGIAVVAGSLLLLIPGIIIGLGLSMAMPLVIDHDLGAFEAVKRSWELMSGHKWKFFLDMLVMLFGGMAIHVLSCGIAGIFIGPLITGGMVLFYDYIAEPGNAYIQY